MPLEQLQAHPALPFDVFTEDGRLLMPAHARLNDGPVWAKLREQGQLFVQLRDYDAWRRGVAQSVDRVLHGNAPLSQLARARTELVHGEIPAMPGDEWEGPAAVLDAALRAPTPQRPWMPRVHEVLGRVRGLAAQRMNEGLFHYIYTGGCRTSLYASRQALRCMLIAGEAARELQWPERHIELLEKVALTMNAASWRLQDQLARQPGAVPQPHERAQLAAHPEESAQLLADSGVSDPDWLEAVRRHHDESLAAQPLAALAPAHQVALLLQRVDAYGAMLSRRAGREPLTATQAAQQACLGADGRPDAIGAALLKGVGLYPPGTFVALASNEHGIVLNRGARANQPVVAALINAQGMAMVEPRLRDTAQSRFAVRAALRPEQVPVDPPLAKLQALRGYIKTLLTAAA